LINVIFYRILVQHPFPPRNSLQHCITIHIFQFNFPTISKGQ